MIKKIIYLAFLLPLAGNAQTTVIKPLVKQPTAFAIITDNQTYANTKDAMHQYKTAVEDDGLATYLISGDWQKSRSSQTDNHQNISRMPFIGGLVYRRCACRIGT